MRAIGFWAERRIAEEKLWLAEGEAVPPRTAQTACIREPVYPWGLFAICFASSRLMLAGGIGACRLGQSRIVTAGHISSLPSGRSHCRKTCTPENNPWPLFAATIK